MRYDNFEVDFRECCWRTGWFVRNGIFRGIAFVARIAAHGQVAGGDGLGVERR